MRKVIAVLAIVGQILVCCNPGQRDRSKTEEVATPLVRDSVVYETDNLLIKKLAAHTYLHTSYLNTNDFGKVPCNGMLVVNENEAVVFDTPADNKSSEELIVFVADALKSKIKAVIATHFHEDCVGGREVFDENNIALYASEKTIEHLRKSGHVGIERIEGFRDSLGLNIAGDTVHAKFFGEGHTSDNVIGYYAEDQVVFGGCLIKEVGAGKGNLDDANVEAWPETVGKIKQQFPTVVVIPGHGKVGGTELFDYTIRLFE